MAVIHQSLYGPWSKSLIHYYGLVILHTVFGLAAYTLSVSNKFPPKFRLQKTFRPNIYLCHSAIVPRVQLWALEMSKVFWKSAVFLGALQIACFENRGVHILWSYEFQRWKEFSEAARTWFHSWLLINIMKDITVCVFICLWMFSHKLNLQP